MNGVYRSLWFVSMVAFLPFEICGIIADLADEFIVQPLHLKATRD